ncbi:hypothetical protein RCL_jg1702.t1 [Rhizophagus clarus]|uniref:Uncharacterized protein n=1 Tax=Rhizophagus clarus TaxID=94130 RepID=A0A8H3LA26_9GLOM|nr:hypothetical protein RCL_jg1702.t1 [Rhizophagus clarus]
MQTNNSYHDWDTCAANLKAQPPVQQQQPIPDIAISQPIQQQSDSMNLDDSQGDTIPSRPSPKQTPSGSQVVTFNNVPPQQGTPSTSSDNSKPSE